MTLSIHASAAAHAAASKHLPNPAQQAKSAEPSVKGAEFGALVSSIARAKHAPAPETTTPPPSDPPASGDLGTVTDIQV